MLCSKAIGTLTGEVIRNRKLGVNWSFAAIAVVYPILMIFLNYNMGALMLQDEQAALRDNGFLEDADERQEEQQYGEVITGSIALAMLTLCIILRECFKSELRKRRAATKHNDRKYNEFVGLE